MAGIVFSCIVPHPPVMVPSIGRGQEAAISDTTQAMKKLNEALARHHPQTLLVISPHGRGHHDAMGILTAASSEGDLASWGSRDPRHHFDNDLRMVELIQKESAVDGIPTRSIGDRGYELDHGVMVPMHFLSPGVKGTALVALTFCWLPLKTHFAFGTVLRRAAEQSKKRVAIIASGDLSHRLIPGAPAGYDPLGKAFDEKLVDALSRINARDILNFDENLVERAGECGLRSIVIMLGALDGLRAKPQILSYEGPFGVGYLVAAFEIAP